MLTGYNWTRSEILKLKDHPTLWNKVTEKLRSIPVDQKVLRWPDGNESIVQNIPFDEESDQVFIDLCHGGGVEKVVFRANPNFMQGSVDCYERLINAGLDVVYVEAGNEPYYAPQVNPTTQEFWKLVFDFRQWNVNMETRVYRLKAKQYVSKVKQLKGTFASRGYNITSIYGYAIPTPRYFKEKEWLRICTEQLPTAQYPIVTLHLYNSDDHDDGEWDIWKSDIVKAIRLVKSKGLRWRTSESNAIHFGAHGQSQNVDLGNTPYHVEKNIDLMMTCKHEGCELWQYHKIAGFDGRRQFHKWDLKIPTLQLIDRQPNFELNPS